MRNIDASIFVDDFFGLQSMRLRLLWIGLILMADDQGRMLDKSLSMKLSIFPYDTKLSTVDIDADLKLLARNNKIVRYTSAKNDGCRKLIQISNWWRYQAGAQWANRSIYPAPPKWTDRVRCHAKGPDHPIILMHWNESGGFFSKSLPSNKVVTRQSLPSEEGSKEHKQDIKQDLKEQALSTPAKTTTPQKKIAPMPAMPALSSLNAEQKKSVDWMKPVLVALGIKGKKLESTLHYVATRNLNGKLKHNILGNIASVYADERKTNKPIIVAMKLESGEDPTPDYLKPESWSVIPKHILQAAGIHDLKEMFTRPELKPFKPDTDNVPRVSMPEDVRVKLNELLKSKDVNKHVRNT